MEYKKLQGRIQIRKRYKDPTLFNGDHEKSFFKEYGPSPLILKDGRNNLYPGIVKDALEYFNANRIAWWGEHTNGPSGHLLSSQIQCLNFLFALRKDKNAVLAFAQLIDSEIDAVLPVPGEADESYLSFEFTHDNDVLLNEKDHQAQRGQFCTSLDVLLIARKANKRILIPVEWKFTEQYPKHENKAMEGSKGITRRNRYNALITLSDQLKTPPQLSASLYYFEPFYELMRQTLLVEQMVRKGMADDFIHVIVVPGENTALLKNSYSCNEKGLIATWRMQLTYSEKVRFMDSKKLLSLLQHLHNYNGLVEYLMRRYS